MTLSCGHEPSPHGAHTTGTAHMPDGREICWECADAWQRERMINERSVSGCYLSGNGMHITTWSGGILASVVSLVTRKVGFGGRRRYYNALDASGKLWYGSAADTGMYTTMRAAKR